MPFFPADADEGLHPLAGVRERRPQGEALLLQGGREPAAAALQALLPAQPAPDRLWGGGLGLGEGKDYCITGPANPIYCAVGLRYIPI